MNVPATVQAMLRARYGARCIDAFQDTQRIDTYYIVVQQLGNPDAFDVYRMEIIMPRMKNLGQMGMYGTAADAVAAAEVMAAG